MAKQTVTLRLDEDDLTYLSQVEISGAANLSEKIRTLLAEARAQRDGMRNSAAAHDFARRLFARIERDVSTNEMSQGIRSELTHRVLSWLPEVTAYALSVGNNDAQASAVESARNLETGLAERVFSLAESMQQLADANFPGCLEREKLASRATFAVKVRS